MNVRRIIGALLCLLILGTAIISCSKVRSDSDSAQTTGTAVETTAETTVYDGLPDKTFDGQEFKFVFRTDQEYQFFTSTLDGEVINDSVYERNSDVENKFDIAISPVSVVGDWANSNTFITTVRSSVMAGDAAFDLIDGYAAYIGTMFSDYLFLNLNSVNYLRLIEPWWSQFAVDELTVNGKLFAIPGDISLNLWQNMQVLYFNKTILTDYNRTEPYTLVNNGTWTYDAYLELIKGIYTDLDGNSKANAADKYGSVFYDDLTFDNFHNAFNIMYTVKNEDGTRDPQLNTEEIVKMYETINDLAYNNPDVTFLKTEGQKGALDMFTSDRALVYASTLTDAETMRTMGSDFGIIPYPKLTEKQEYYKTTSRDNRSMFCIPIDVADPDFAGLITEALCVVSNSKVITAYYDVVLKGKIARDNDSELMLDIIRGGVTFDFVSEYAIQTERAGFILRDSIYYKKNIVTYYTQNEKKFIDALNKFIALYYDDTSAS